MAREAEGEQQTRRTARLSVSYSEARGQDVVHVFGLPDRRDRGPFGPATQAVWDRAITEAREAGSALLDIDEFLAAQRADRDGRADGPASPS